MTSSELLYIISAIDKLANFYNEHGNYIREQDCYRMIDGINLYWTDIIKKVDTTQGLDVAKAYDLNYGDDKPCGNCGHAYYRHFDSYEDMSPVGCKYCECMEFVKV